MELVIKTDRVCKLNKPYTPAGGTITIVNQSATDVFCDTDPAVLYPSAPGTTTPTGGVKIVAAGGQLQWPNPAQQIFFRAGADTVLKVLP